MKFRKAIIVFAARPQSNVERIPRQSVTLIWSLRQADFVEQQQRGLEMKET